jgi:A/G-specific adenine glycosylase
MLPPLRSAVRRKLLRWYRDNKRDLPWRRSRDPYAIWISETMLQQTQVATVVPYYRKFLEQFPTVAALARAPLPRVLRQWSGLGYYRRAANLKRAAQEIVQRDGGRLPEDFARLRALPGIGEYTAGALSSIAFGKRHPAIDGNARRVLSRVLRATDEGKLRAAAAELVPTKQPGEFNQALMELGATVCLPKDPHCSVCPLSSFCAGRSGRYPALGAPPAVKIKNVIWPLVIVRQAGKILLRRRPASGLLAGLWELPGREAAGKGSIVDFLLPQLNGASMRAARPRIIGEIRHAITYRRIRAPVYLLDFADRRKLSLSKARWRWIEPAKLRNYAVSSMTTKAVGLLVAHEKNPR